jgi:DNA repair exonuclease SbcCD nuclease subunit
MNLFNRAMVFTDIHLGLRHNSAEHNQDCVDYIDWFISEAKKRNAETCIFMGDFFHHRNTINSQTLDFSIKLLSKINLSFNKSYFIVGNHDLYWRESRDVTSMKFATLFPNIVLVDKILIEDNVAMIPWLVEDEWKQVSTIKSKYLFGHLELPGFKMNANVEMPDNGTLNAEHFKHQDAVFSGHFHMRQGKGKICYIGNPFGHNYSDVWDFERGGMFLEWGKQPQFLNYEDGPRFISINLAALLADPDLYLKPKTYLQVTLDLDITYEEASFLRETFLTQYSVREFKLVKSQDDDTSVNFGGAITMKTVDQIVIEQLTNIESTSIDPKKLIEIYNGL